MKRTNYRHAPNNTTASGVHGNWSVYRSGLNIEK